MGMGQVVDYSQFILQIEKAIANGVATLDSSAKVPKNQINLVASDVGAQPLGDELTALQSLADTTGFLRKTGNGSYLVDVSSYLNLTGGTVTGQTTFSNTTASTSTTTGGVVVAGGLGVSGSLNTGGTINNVSIGCNDSSSLKIGNYITSSTGANFTAIGSFAGYANANGSDWTAVGWTAGIQISSSFWTAIGANAGRFQSDGITGLTISNNSCFIGANTKGTDEASNENVFGYNAIGNGSNTVTIGDSNITNNFFRGAISLNGNQILTSRRTGWDTPTGTATRTTFETSTVTLPQLAERVKALIDNLITHGLIGA